MSVFRGCVVAVVFGFMLACSGQQPAEEKSTNEATVEEGAIVQEDFESGDAEKLEKSDPGEPDVVTDTAKDAGQEDEEQQ